MPVAAKKSTVSEVLQREQKAKIIWPTDLKEKELLRLLYPPVDKPLSLPEPDVEYIFYEMKKRSVTLMLLWEEYKEVYPHGLMYTMHIEHKAGEEIQVDLSWISGSLHKPSLAVRKDLQIFS